MSVAIKKEGALPNGLHTNHERDFRANGLNGSVPKPDAHPNQEKEMAEFHLTNGAEVHSNHKNDNNGSIGPEPQRSSSLAHRMDELPEEIQHITEDIMPLGLLLTRLAQATHNETERMIGILAAKSLPDAIVNGNSDYRSTNNEDASPESLDKKRILLDFLQQQHTKWVKALVLTEWSKRSAHIGRLIDIRSYLATQLDQFTANLGELINVKRDLHWARLPAPDLKTALQVLEEGEASFLPEFGYIEPPPMPLEEIARTIDQLNTILSVRLTTEEFGTMPVPFRDYTIRSGRVTFRVDGEFEVDLTVADEDFDSQFWFIDFRLLGTPAITEIPEYIRNYVEQSMNGILKSEGLVGCYRHLHEMVLTLKIAEIRRQAVELSRGRWADSLKVERLNRAMSFQYWANRYPTLAKETQSWVIIGVRSCNGSGGTEEGDSPSSIFLRWFRDGKEVKDFDIPLDVNNIRVESLLKSVVARHIEYVLMTLQGKLLSKPRFSSRHSHLDLAICRDEPDKTRLKIQLFDDKSMVICIDPISGIFTMTPMTPLVMEGQKKLNSMPSVSDDVPMALEKLRCLVITQELHHRYRTSLWNVARPPIRADELKVLVQIREAYHAVWLRNRRLPDDCYVLLTLSPSGDRWWMLQLSSGNPRGTNHVGLFTQVPMSSQQVSLSEEFMDHLLAFLSGLITQICDIKDLKSRRVRHVMRAMQNPRLPPQVKLPTLAICLTDLLRPRNGASQSMRLWAHNFVTVGFHGIQHPPDLQRSVDPEPARHPLLNYVVEARLTVTDKSKFSQLKGRVDRDVVYSPRTGQFALRLRAEVGKHLLGILVPRLRALERLVDFVDAIRRGGQGITPQSMSLRTISFSYGDGGVQGASASPVPKSWQVRLDLTRDENIDIVLGKGSPHLRVVDCLSTFASARFDQLPQALLVTLPLYRALDRIESAWTDIVANQQGHVAIFVKTLEWLTLRYTMTSSHSPASERVLQLDIKPQSRKGSTLWHVRRLDPERAVTTSPNSAATATTANHGSEPPDDYLNKVLAQKVWNTSGTGWAGLGTGAAASLEQGIEPLLDLIDQTVRSLVGPPPSFMAAPPSSSAHQKHNPHGVVGSLPAPTAKPAQSAAAPPQQRPPPQQIISPNHGRAGSAKGTGPAVVVID